MFPDLQVWTEAVEVRRVAAQGAEQVRAHLLTPGPCSSLTVAGSLSLSVGRLHLIPPPTRTLGSGLALPVRSSH